MNCKVLPVLTLIFFIFAGYRSFRSTPYTIDTVHDISVQGTKICIEGEYNPFHFAEERIVEITASHNKYSIQRVDASKIMFNELLNMKESENLRQFPFYNHFIDSKRDDSVMSFTIPPFQDACFEVTLEKARSPLQITLHTTTKFCPFIYFFALFQSILFFVYPRGFLYEVYLFLFCLLFIVSITSIHPYISSYTQYKKVGHMIGLPILRFCNMVLLIVSHTIKPIENLFSLIQTRLLCSQHVKVIMLAWLSQYWRESIISALVLIVTIYIFYPSRNNYNAAIRLMCVVTLSVALVYASSQLVVKIVGLVIVLLVLVLKAIDCTQKI